MTMKFNNTQRVFISSDFHYGHKNIVLGETDWDVSQDENKCRKFATRKEMNDTLVNNINDTVGAGDVLIFLGDFAFGGIENIFEFRKRINCKTIHVVTGNHDHHFEKPEVRALFTSVNAELKVSYKYDNRPVHDKLYQAGTAFIHMFHHPISSWHDMSKGSIHLHGHLHNVGDDRFLGGRSMDVGIDGHPEFKPYDLYDVVRMVKSFKAVNTIASDHHKIGFAVSGQSEQLVCDYCGKDKEEGLDHCKCYNGTAWVKKAN